MMTSAFIMSRSEYVLGRPRERLAGSGGQGSRSTRTIRLTSRLGCRSISVPPQCGCVITEIRRGQPCCGDAWHGCFTYDHVSPNSTRDLPDAPLRQKVFVGDQCSAWIAMPMKREVSIVKI